jgi:hypothetical protein
MDRICSLLLRHTAGQLQPTTQGKVLNASLLPVCSKTTHLMRMTPLRGLLVTVCGRTSVVKHEEAGP